MNVKTLMVPIKAKFTINDIEKMAKKYFGLICVSIKELNGYEDNNYHLIVQQLNYNNKYIDNICSSGYILKVINVFDSKKSDFFKAQTEILLYLRDKEICCPKPVKCINGEYFIKCKSSSNDNDDNDDDDDDDDGMMHLVRLLEYIDGEILYKTIDYTKQLFYQIGKYVGNLDKVLKGFHHPVFNNHKHLWMLESVPQLKNILHAINDINKRDLINIIIEQFSNRVLNIINNFEKGIIHGDFNEQNILIDNQSIKGILDFGDSHYSCYLFELAITMSYMMLQTQSIEIGGYVLAGYISIMKLSQNELQLLKICICARLSQSLVMGIYSNLCNPTNSYVLTTNNKAWILLEKLWTETEENLMRLWNSIVIQYNNLS